MGYPFSAQSIARSRGRVGARPAVRRALAGAASIVLLSGLATLSPVASAGATALDTADPAAVAAAYTAQYVPAMADSIGWTGTTSPCNAGTTSSRSPAVTLAAINYVRSLAGLDPVSFDSALSAKAQQAALMMSANGTLSHDPPSSWKCYTSTGADAASSSNLALGAGGGRAVGLYMSDPGAGNAEVGHRRWVLYPRATTFGTGSTSNANALYVFGKTAATGAFSNPEWVPWPTAGYFPEPLEPAGRWSLSLDAANRYDLSHATVSVKDAAGRSLAVAVDAPSNGYGNDTLVWEVAGLAKPAVDSEADYTVTVSGMKNGSATLSYSYVVQLFNPDSVPTPPAAAPPVQHSASVSHIGRAVHCARTAVCSRPDTAVRPASSLTHPGSSAAVPLVDTATRTRPVAAARAPASSASQAPGGGVGSATDRASESPEPLGG